jgi:hypothetical protein
VSSAILYVAIVVIWACVLIPRWLRRDSARGAGNEADTRVAGDVVVGDVVPDEDTVDSGVARDDDMAGPDHARYAHYPDDADYTGYTDYGNYGETAGPDEAPEAGEVPKASEAPEAARAVPESGAETHAPRPAPKDSRRRMLAARRRLLGMLVLLQIAAITLAVSGLAALWVLIPPSIMLIGYVLLLREASHADAERAQREEEAARARARAQARARERAARRTAAAPPRAAATPPPAPRYEDTGPGRDFAPGLAGKYTTSNAELIDSYEEAEEDFRDEYTVKKLRAVGD